MAISSDLICSIFKKLPIDDQYETAANYFLDDSEHMEEFVKRKEYLESTRSKIVSDVGSKYDPWIQKYGRNLQGDYKFDVICNIKIYGFLDVPVPEHGIHKIPVWKELWKAGLVSDYYLQISKSITTELEHVLITFTVTNKDEDNFVATLEVTVWENKEGDTGFNIIKGVKDVAFSSSSIPDIWFAQGEILEGYDTFLGTKCDYEDGSTVIFEDQPGCAYEDYKIGFSAEALGGLVGLKKVTR